MHQVSRSISRWIWAISSSVRSAGSGRARPAGSRRPHRVRRTPSASRLLRPARAASHGLGNVRPTHRRASRSLRFLLRRRSSSSRKSSAVTALALRRSGSPANAVVGRDHGERLGGRVGRDQLLDPGVGVLVSQGEDRGRVPCRSSRDRNRPGGELASKTTVVCRARSLPSASASVSQELASLAAKRLAADFLTPDRARGMHQVIAIDEPEHASNQRQQTATFTTETLYRNCRTARMG